ncbi:AAA family ATPase [Pseudomonas sp. D47]|uniref:AAA family ATPase n=1 Tax=Pseudomonas sp. D47 TaxID=3159447 RepID=UPI00387AE902
MRVKSALADIFYGKCGYCEKGIGHSELAVHHHRPLMNAKGRVGYPGAPSPDHYVWYAYEWNNFVLACATCVGFKNTQFPTQKSRIAPFTPFEFADEEGPVLIDPSHDNPYDHLKFHPDGACIGRTQRGEETVEILKLNRSELKQLRARLFSELIVLIGQLRGSSSANILSTLERNLDDRHVHIGAAKNWITDALLATSVRKTPPGMGQFITELGGFIDFSDSTMWDDFIDHLSGQTRLKTVRPADETETDDEDETTQFARIRSVHIRNFKGFGNFNIEFSSLGVDERGIAPAVVLLGENAVGKSSLLQAIALGTMSPSLSKQVKVSFDSFLRHSRSEPRQPPDSRRSAQARIKVTFDDGNINEVNIQRGGVIRRKNFSSTLVLGYGAHRFFDDQSTNYENIEKVSSIVSLFDKQRDLPHSAEWLKSLGKETFPTVARTLREVLNLGNEDEIICAEQGGIFIRKGGEYIPLPQLSDGYRSLFAMALDIMRNMVNEWGSLESSRGLVLIDEIEIHLHPRWKMQVVSALRNAMPQVQFIFTTHDPLCLRGMFDGEVHVLLRDDAKEIVELKGLPGVTGMRAEQLLTSEYFGLASTSEPETLRRLDELVLSDNHNTLAQEQFSERLDAFTMIGDTPERQVVNEALRRHIVEQFRSNRLDRAEVREESINLILQRLRSDASEVGE